MEPEEEVSVRPRVAWVEAIVECYRQTLDDPYPGDMRAILNEARGKLSDVDFQDLQDGLVAAWLCWRGQQILGLRPGPQNGDGA